MFNGGHSPVKPPLDERNASRHLSYLGNVTLQREEIPEVKFDRRRTVTHSNAQVELKDKEVVKTFSISIGSDCKIKMPNN